MAAAVRLAAKGWQGPMPIAIWPAMNAPLPRSIPEYLDQLRAALAGADKALVQDALYDAEEYLRRTDSE